MIMLRGTLFRLAVWPHQQEESLLGTQQQGEQQTAPIHSIAIFGTSFRQRNAVFQCAARPAGELSSRVLLFYWRGSLSPPRDQ